MASMVAASKQSMAHGINFQGLIVQAKPHLPSSELFFSFSFLFRPAKATCEPPIT